ncbi:MULTISPECIES: hypothetical protein [Haloferax]|uniref:hypothetical protein n=1 Tax=Haloferax TaxID=2251 RepID=UPI0017842FAD|nr:MULTISPECIES: hypothetical protein [Haloferax]
MSPGDEGYRRRSRHTSLDERHGGLDAWLDAIVYYGLGQHLLLAVPVLWIAFQAVTTPVAVTTSAIVALSVASLTIGAFRMGVISVGVPWRRIEDNDLGLGPTGGYGFFARRAAYLNATLGLGTFAGALADTAGGLGSAILVAGGFTLGSLLVLPHIRGASGTRTLVRALYYGVSLSVIAVGGQVLDLSVGAPSAVVAFGLICLFVIVDIGLDVR